MSHQKSKNVRMLVLVLGCMLAGPLGASQASVVSELSPVQRVSAGQLTVSTHRSIHVAERASASKLSVRANTNEPNPFVMIAMGVLSAFGLRRVQAKSSALAQAKSEPQLPESSGLALQTQSLAYS